MTPSLGFLERDLTPEIRQRVLTPTSGYRNEIEIVGTNPWCKMGVEKPHITDYYHDHA